MNLGKPSPGPVMLDVAGTTLTDDDLRRIAHPRTGGVILFRRNLENRVQLCTLTHAIRSVRPDVLIAVDQEGGRVQRFKTDGFTPLPAAAQLGRLWDRDVLAASRAATALGYVLAAELRASGIDLSFTPVLDLDYRHSGSRVIGDRALHADPRVVTLLAKSVCHGLALAGMANCGKHFPGHGFVETDTHLDGALDQRSRQTILEADARPYAWLGMALQSVMAAHVVYPDVDALPAGFSRRWLTDILRGELGFTGAIFSDDLSMEGARVAGDVVRGAQLALDAGCDMVLVCNRPELADRLLAELPPTQSRASVRRLRRLAPRGKPTSWSRLERQPEYLAARALVLGIDSGGSNQ